MRVADTVAAGYAKTLLAKWFYEYFSADSTPHCTGAVVSYTRREIRCGPEGATFIAAGSVELAPGAAVGFSFDLSLNRERTEINGIALRVGPATDLITVNLDGAGVRSHDGGRPFDLNGERIDEMIAALAEGAAGLPGDLDSTPIPAPQHRRYGWTDEIDAPYGQLRLWPVAP